MWLSSPLTAEGRAHHRLRNRLLLLTGETLLLVLCCVVFTSHFMHALSLSHTQHALTLSHTRIHTLTLALSHSCQQIAVSSAPLLCAGIKALGQTPPRQSHSLIRIHEYFHVLICLYVWLVCSSRSTIVTLLQVSVTK